MKGATPEHKKLFIDLAGELRDLIHKEMETPSSKQVALGRIQKIKRKWRALEHEAHTKVTRPRIAEWMWDEIYEGFKRRRKHHKTW